MTKLHSDSNIDKIKEVWKQLESDKLDYVINLLRSNFYIDHTKEINSVYALIPIIAFVY